MRKILALCSVLAVSGCAVIIAPGGDDARFETMWSSNAIKGNGDIITDKRQVNGAPILNISGPLQMEVRIGGSPSLEIIGDSNLVGLVQMQAAGDTQKIWLDDKFYSNSPIRVVYTVPSLREVSSSGSGRLLVNGLNGSDFAVKNTGSRTVILEGHVAQLDISSIGSGRVNATGLTSSDARARVQGSGSLSLGAVTGNELNISIHGSGSVNASGQVKKLVAQTHGSGSAELSAVKSQNADLSSHGSGDVFAAVTQSVIAQTNGSGNITVYGNPAQRNVNGKRVSFIH